MITMDFETRSACKLKECGTYIYSIHPSTEIMCLAWAYDDEEDVYIWHPGMPERWHLDELLRRVASGEIVEAHNAMFERCIWTNVGFVEGWPELDPRQIRCSAAKVAALTLPRALGDAIKALGIPVPKDEQGRKLMMKLAKPRKPGIQELHAVGLEKGQHQLYWERHGYTWHEKPEDLRRLYEYCRQDVRAERALSRATRDLSPEEQEVWFLDQEINWRGIYVDREAVAAALKIYETVTAESNAEMCELTYGAVPRCTLRIPFMRWMGEQGCLIPDTKKETMEEWDDKDLDPHVHRAIELWRTVNHASVKKYVKMKVTMAPDSRIRGTLMYHGAGPGRWAGKLIQPQNFVRGVYSGYDPNKPDKVTMDEVWEDILKWDHEALKQKYGNLMKLISNTLRGAICAPPGKELQIADYASIEARVLFWMVGATRALDVLNEGKNIYKDMTGAIMEFLGKPVPDPQTIEKGTDDYQLGKQSILGLGYQMGGPKFRETCAGYGIEVNNEFSKSVVKLYRETYPEVPQLWRAMEAAAIQAVLNGPNAAVGVQVANVRWCMRGDFLHCKLPSGRLLSYYSPVVIDATTPWGAPTKKLMYMGVDSHSKKWCYQKTFGGKLVENVVQAIARDLMAAAMIRIQGTVYQDITMTVHDEIVSEVDQGVGSIKEFEELMSELPPWAMGFPVGAEGFSAQRYRK